MNSVEACVDYSTTYFDETVVPPDCKVFLLYLEVVGEFERLEKDSFERREKAYLN